MELIWHQTLLILAGLLVVPALCLYNIFCQRRSPNSDQLEDPEVAPPLEGAAISYMSSPFGFVPSASQLLYQHNNLRPTAPVIDGAYLNPVFNGSDLPPPYNLDDLPPAYNALFPS